MLKERLNRYGEPAEGFLYLLMRRLSVSVLIVMLAGQFAERAGAQQQAVASQEQESSSTQQALPDSPVPAGADRAPSEQKQASDSAQVPSGTSAPVGTAAAPYVKPSGMVASRPAGAAIAPAKQRRAHSFVIKFAVIAGAAAAGGAVVALSSGSRSRP